MTMHRSFFDLVGTEHGTPVIDNSAFKKTFKKAFNRVLKEAGFRNKGQSWYLDGEEVGVMLNLQKCDYDEKYYLNFGVFFTALTDEASPREYTCPINGRITSLFPDDIRTVEDGCRIDAKDDTALLRFLDIMKEKVIPFCVECSQPAHLRAKLRGDVFRGAYVRKDARDLLGV